MNLFTFEVLIVYLFQMSAQKSTAYADKSKATPDIKGAKRKSEPIFLFDKRNYTLMVIGFVVVIIGFLLMLGGKSTDPNVFDQSEIYSFRRITLAPIFIILGFVIEVFAIMLKPKSSAQNS